jgi:hypothetical protein
MKLHFFIWTVFKKDFKSVVDSLMNCCDIDILDPLFGLLTDPLY